MSGPIEVLGQNRRAIVGAAAEVGAKRLRQVLARAQHELNVRLRKVEGLSGPGKDSFTAHQLRVALAQIGHVLVGLTRGIEALSVEQAKAVSDPAVEGVIRYLHAAEKRFRGITERLPLRDAVLFERAKSGAESSVLHRLESDPKRGPGILKRYGDAVIEKFEGHLQQRLLARSPWADVRNQLIADSPFLQQAPAHWAERIVRTESMNGSNRAIWEANKAADEQLGDVVKILSATFDDRTGADSVAVHGQIRKPSEAFEWWDGLYQHPPNRPNDREVVVTHRLSWPLPAELAWRSDAEVHARWVANGRKGTPPGRPKMTTVDVSQFGKVPPPKIEDQQQKAFAPRPIIEPPFIPERPPRAPVASPDFDENVTPFVSPPDEMPSLAAEPVDLFFDKVGGQKGSNEGGLYRGSDGVLRYAKFYQDPLQAQVEHVANQIYRDLGLPAVKSDVVTGPGGRQAYVSEVVEGETLGSKKKIGKADANQVLKGFAADVLVGNWDAVGLNHDNVILSKKKAYRIDNGGALLYRAKAGMKPAAVLGKIDEWEKFFDSGTNPAYAQVAKAAGVSRAEDIKGIDKQIQAIQKLRKAHGGWDKYIDHVAPDLPADAKIKLVDMLAARTQLLGEKLEEMKTAAKLGPAKAPVRLFEKLAEHPLPEIREDKPVGFSSRREFQELALAKNRAIADRVEGFSHAVNDYTAAGYGDIREAGKYATFEEYQAKNPSRSREQYEAYRRKYDRIDRAFDVAQQVTEGPITTHPEARVAEAYRGLGNLSRAVFDRILNYDVIEMETVTSTSWSPDVAKSFMYRDGDRYAVMLHFKMKPTSHNKLSVETISSQGDHEREILLRKGARFRVTKAVRAAGRKNTAVVELEEI